MVRARRVRKERHSIGWLLKGHARPPTPCTITLTRIAPSSGMDDDGLAGSLKGVRDAVADWIGVDDRHAEVVRYVCKQARGPWGIRVEWEA